MTEFDFEDLPGFMLERAIAALERLREQIDHEIALLRREQSARDWTARHKARTEKITADLIRCGETDEPQALDWLMEQGHSPKYAREILSAMRKRIEAEKKAAREVEIFRRWSIGKERKTSLAREFGLSRSTVERICAKYAKNDGLRQFFKLASKKAPHNAGLSLCVGKKV